MGASSSLKWVCSSSSTRCQSSSRFGPSKKPSSDTDMCRTIFLIACSSPRWDGSPRQSDRPGPPKSSALRRTPGAVGQTGEQAGELLPVGGVPLGEQCVEDLRTVAGDGGVELPALLCGPYQGRASVGRVGLAGDEATGREPA